MSGLLAVVAVIGAACSNETAGQPTPGSTSQAPTTSSNRIPLPFPSTSSASTQPSTGGQAGPLASTDPCTLSAQAATQVSAGAGTASDLGEGRACRYQANGITLEVTIYDTQGLKDVVSSGQPQQTKIGGHDALRGQEPPNLCVINMSTGDTSRVDVVAGARGDQTKACQVATQAATAIEPSLPG